MQVVHVHPVDLRAKTELIRRAVNAPALRAAAGHPHGEAVVVVVAAVDLAGVRSGCGQLDCRRPAKLPAPKHERLVEQSALFEIR